MCQQFHKTTFPIKLLPFSLLHSVNSQLRGKLEEQLDCSFYPNLAEKLSTPATEIVSPTIKPAEPPATPRPSPDLEPTADEVSQTDSGNDGKPPSVNFPYPEDDEDDSRSSASLNFVSKLLILSMLMALITIKISLLP